MLPIKKIYIDSRNRTADSISSSNFKIELDHTIQLPEHTVFFVTDVCIPHVFQLIETGVNDRLYYKYSAPRATNQYSINAYYIIITLPSGGQPSGTTLATEIQTTMNANVDPESAISFTVTWDSSQYSINVSTVGANASFKFLTEDEIVFNAIWWNGQFDPSNTKSANDILKNRYATCTN